MIRSSFLIFTLLLLCCFKVAEHSAEFVFQNDSDILQNPCAIFIAPTAEQIDSLKIKMKEKDFYNLIDNNMSYFVNARLFLESKKLSITNVEAKGSIKFKKKDGKIIDYPIFNLTWAIVLFNGKSDPIVANMVSVENDYTRYMK